MPKGALKSKTKAKREKTEQDTEMKEVAQTTSATSENECGTSANHDVGNMSVNSSEQAKKDKSNDSPPGKPRRVFVLAGTILKKKDAKTKDKDTIKKDNATPENIDTHGQVEKGEDEKPSVTDEITHNKVDTDPNKDEGHPPVDILKARSSFGDDDHPYEDPSIVVNNSTTLQQQKQQEKPFNIIQKPRKTPEMKQRSPSPGFTDVKISTENIKAKKSAKNHLSPSVMAEHSIPRSIFAILVALLLSLIIFLALFFLLHCHPVLSVVLAVLVFLLIFVVLGFLDMVRIKCLILLFLPSACSRGGKFSLYVLLLYFVVKGPLCNTIGNIKSVRHSVICINNERFRYSIGQTFNAAQKCTDYYGNKFTTSTNSSREELSCLKKTCLATKDKLWQNCASKIPKISKKVCNMTEDLSCDKLNQSNSRNLAENCQAPCQKEFGKLLEILGEETDGSHCGFLEVIGMLLPLLIVLLFYEAYNYEKNYQTYNGFHNYFLTGNFQRIDQSRSSCDRQAVLPLRKVELRQHVRPTLLCQTTDGEKKLIHTSLKLYLGFLLIVLFVILVDLYVFRMFNIDQQQVSVETPVLFKHNASILVDVSKNSTSNHTNLTLPKMNKNDSLVNTNNHTNQTVSNSSPQYPDKVGNICLVMVESPGAISKILLPVLLILLLFVILLQAYIIRLQWFICSRFYNEREKERVFYLYNKILEDRVHLVEDCRNRMKCYHREMNTLNYLEPTRILANQSKWLSKLLKFFHVNLRKCVICHDSEKAAFKICHGADCSGVYCLTCSFDIDKKCLYCDTKLKRNLSKRQPPDKDISSKESLV